MKFPAPRIPHHDSANRCRSALPGIGLALAIVSLAPLVMAAAVLAQDKAQRTAVPPDGDTRRIQVINSATSWDNLSELFLSTTPAAPFGEGSVFVMRGELRNTGDRPVRYVVLRYELLDDNGKVLQDAEGFNRSAESMRPDEEGNVHAELVKPIPPGGVDSYRMVFFYDEVPRFKSQRVRVSEVHEDAAPTAPPPSPAGKVEDKK